MVKKFTLSVSDDLAERIDRYRDHLGNLSGLFQSAVDEKISKKEAFDLRLKEDPDLDEIVARLRREKDQAENDLFDSGKKEGLSWAKYASYTDIKSTLNNDYEFEYGGSTYISDSVFKDDSIGDYLLEAFKEDPVLSADSGEVGLGELQEQWFRGWLEGVNEFWDHVSAKL